MRIALFMFTCAATITLLLQLMCPKGGVWHRRRALLAGILPAPPILWNLAHIETASVLFSLPILSHLCFGILYYYFWFRACRLGTYAVKTATQTETHQRFAIKTVIALIAAFLVPYLLGRFIE
mgnify:CR=1 FL=1